MTVLPELATALPEEDRRLAERVLLAPVLKGDEGDLAERVALFPDAFDFIVLDGVVLKETTYATRSALELLGPGDVLAPPLTPGRQLESSATSRYLAHGPTSLAVLDGRFRQAARRWPGLSDLLHERLGRQTHRASMHMALLHIPRAEGRLLALFTDLGERLGKMTPEGIAIDVNLSHELIGRLIAARRPTVTLALQAVASSGRLRKTDGRWLLQPDQAG